MKTSRSLLAAVAAGISLAFSGAALAQGEKPAETSAETKPVEPVKPEAKPADAAPTAAAAQPTPATEEKLVYVKMETSKGDIIIELNHEKAPITVTNFLGYVAKKHYDGTIFHRVIPTFMIQGGGHTADMSEKPTGPSIKNEAKNGLKNVRGAIAMARKPSLDSATAQFFINVVDNPFLDNPASPYAVFGKVVAGMETVDKIKDVKTGTKNGMGDVPLETVTINAVTKITLEDAKKAGMK